jgi:sugar transferase (PEP-CTERM system associated)
MIRLFNVYYPARSLLMVVCEALLACASFTVATTFLLGIDNSYIRLVYEDGLLKIIGITILTMLFSYYFDLYEPQRISERWEAYFRLLLVLGALSFVLAGLILLFPQIEIGPNVLAVGVLILTLCLIGWRRVDEWLTECSLFRDRVYVLGYGARASRVVDVLVRRRDAGMTVVGWTGHDHDVEHPENTALGLRPFCKPKPDIDRVIVAMEERRGCMPIRELLDLRLRGVIIEDDLTLLERILGRLPLEGLTPSSLVFTDGFRVKAGQQIVRRMVSFAVALIALLVCLPLIPVLAISVRFSSPGPALFRQRRVGLRGRLFTLYKFRTMRQDAEANGAVWAARHDPRITRIGDFMRKTRLDEIPQLWNVLRGDMGFVGPRPERPEFVEWLGHEIPYYDLRHMIRPGITGWAQVRYQYGATLEETKRKLEYDLYYLKHLSLGLDLLILFETAKTIVLRRGAQ